MSSQDRILRHLCFFAFMPCSPRLTGLTTILLQLHGKDQHLHPRHLAIISSLFPTLAILQAKGMSLPLSGIFVYIRAISMGIHDGDNESVEKCMECNGCINCTVEFCIFNSYGNAEACYRNICTYCDRFLQKQRLFLNNVG